MGGALGIATFGSIGVAIYRGVLGAARDAFVRGLVLCQGISGIGTLALAVFAWRTFRRVATSAR